MNVGATDVTPLAANQRRHGAHATGSAGHEVPPTPRAVAAASNAARTSDDRVAAVQGRAPGPLRRLVPDVVLGWVERGAHLGEGTRLGLDSVGDGRYRCPCRRIAQNVGHPTGATRYEDRAAG